MKRAFLSFAVRPLLLASMLTSIVALAAPCTGMPPSAVAPACHSKATYISQQAYTTVYNAVMQSCSASGASNCTYYAETEATTVKNNVYSHQYNTCVNSGGPC